MGSENQEITGNKFFMACLYFAASIFLKIVVRDFLGIHNPDASGLSAIAFITFNFLTISVPLLIVLWVVHGYITSGSSPSQLSGAEPGSSRFDTLLLLSHFTVVAVSLLFLLRDQSSYNEVFYTYGGYSLMETGALQAPDDDASILLNCGLLVQLIIGLVSRVSQSPVALRLPFMLFHIGAYINLNILVGRSISKEVQAYFAAFYSLSPVVLKYTILIQPISLILFLFSLSLLVTYLYIDGGGTRYLVVLVIVGLLLILTRLDGFVFIVICLATMVSRLRLERGDLATYLPVVGVTGFLLLGVVLILGAISTVTGGFSQALYLLDTGRCHPYQSTKLPWMVTVIDSYRFDNLLSSNLFPMELSNFTFTYLLLASVGLVVMLRHMRDEDIVIMLTYALFIPLFYYFLFHKHLYHLLVLAPAVIILSAIGFAAVMSGTSNAWKLLGAALIEPLIQTFFYLRSTLLNLPDPLGRVQFIIDPFDLNNPEFTEVVDNIDQQLVHIRKLYFALIGLQLLIYFALWSSRKLNDLEMINFTISSTIHLNFLFMLLFQMGLVYGPEEYVSRFPPVTVSACIWLCSLLNIVVQFVSTLRGSDVSSRRSWFAFMAIMAVSTSFLTLRGIVQ